jgi:hypothetical protein
VADTATLEALGFTKEEVFQRVVDTIVRDLTQSRYEDEDGDHYFGESEFKRGVDKAVRKAIDAKVTAVADTHITPRVSELIDNVTLQQTNSWGEKTGSPVTFTEYLVQRAEAYMVEPLSFDGKTKGESSSYGWSAKTTRVAYMVDRHLHYSIDTAMKKALADANTTIAKGLNDAVTTAIKNITVQVKTEVKS